MGQLVKLVVGVWEHLGSNGWLFVADPTEQRHEVMVHENQTYASLVELVRIRYSVGSHTAVALTYEYPEWMKVPGDLATPPVDVKVDGDVELFMSVRLDIPEMRLKVTIGNDNVARYLFQRRDEFTVIGSSAGNLAPNPIPYRGKDNLNPPVEEHMNNLPEVIMDKSVFWEGMLAQGWLTGSQKFLMGVCTDEEMENVTERALTLTRATRDPDIDLTHGESSTDSSASPLNVGPRGPVNEIIRLQPREVRLSDTPNLALAIVGTQPRCPSVGEYFSKGKGKEGDPDGEYVPLFDNKYHADPEPEHDSTDEDDLEDGKPHLYVGQVFVDRHAFKTHMSLYALANKFRYLCKRSEPGKMMLECNGSNCNWRVYAAKIAGCPRVYEEHKCTVDERGDFKRHATTTLIGDMMRTKYGVGGSGPRPNAVREFMRDVHDVPISYWKAWKSRELAMDRGISNTEDSYRKLPSYLKQLAISNPGSVVALETSTTSAEVQQFKYLFFAFGASVKGYSYMRKVIIVDGTHLKGKYTGCLLTASAQDGNHQIFPLGFGVVDGENEASWTWFFSKLLDVVADDYDVVFVTDRHNSIYAGLRKMYPKAKHCACVLHLQRNVVTMFKKKHLAYLVSKAARAFRVCDFYKHFNEIKMIDMDCADYLIRVGFEHWSRSHFGGLRYNVMTSNIAESLNAALSEAREFPIVALVEYIRTMLMGWFSVRREAAGRTGGLLTPKIEELLSKNFSLCTGYMVRHINKSEYEVRGRDGVPYSVDLDNKSCSC